MTATALTPRPRTLVVAALVRRDGRILVSRRRADQEMPLLWEFPGGKVEPGEAPVVALAREVAEEVGCERGHWGAHSARGVGRSRSLLIKRARSR